MIIGEPGICPYKLNTLSDNPGKLKYIMGSLLFKPLFASVISTLINVISNTDTGNGTKNPESAMSAIFDY